jgi:hypothetical protein
MELRNALFRATLLRKRIRYSIAAPSQVKVILPSSPPANPNSSCDILRSSLNTSELRYTNGTSKRLPSAEYTTQWPLPATGVDAEQDSSVSFAGVVDGVSLFLASAATLCHFFAIWASLFADESSNKSQMNQVVLS